MGEQQLIGELFHSEYQPITKKYFRNFFMSFSSVKDLMSLPAEIAEGRTAGQRKSSLGNYIFFLDKEEK